MPRNELFLLCRTCDDDDERRGELPVSRNRRSNNSGLNVCIRSSGSISLPFGYDFPMKQYWRYSLDKQERFDKKCEE